jgi:hypothetical protein
MRYCSQGLALAALAAILVGAGRVEAQTQGSQQGGLTGRTSTGQTAGSGSTLSQTQGYGLDTRFTGSGFNRFMSGSSTMGQTTAGAGAATAGAFGQSAGQAGEQSRFGSSQQLGLMGMMGGLGRGGMFGMNNMMGGMGTQQNQQQGKVRTHLRLGFETPGQPAGTVGPRFTQVVQRVLDRPDVGGGQVSVTLEGSTAVLTGTVASKHARDVVERLAMLEPGIGAVRNELTVRPDEPTRESEPTPNTAGQRP